MALIKSIEFNKTQDDIGFPYQLGFFNVPIDLSSVNIIVGDNGSGKSTLLELLAQKLKLYQIGQPLILPKPIDISIKYTLTKPKGFYFSAEDFTSYINQLEKDKAESKQAIKEIEIEYKDRSDYSKLLAKSPHMRTLGEINHLYEKDLLTSSHGESYLSFFKSRIKPGQLFLLDEPETPLSFDNQLALIYIIHEATLQGAQFIIATHSPIISACPKAKIFKLTNQTINETSYDTLESVQLLKDFLNNPDRYFHHLFH
ncbi:MAG: AAA family ATPase [Acholeplasmataceae bacterium]